MSADVALQAMFDRFLGRFMLPLVRGGEKVLVSYPIGLGALAYFEIAQQTDVTVASELVLQRQTVLRDLVPNPDPEAVDADDIRLLAALHNVLLCEHEELVGGMRGKARWGHCIDWAREHLAKVPACADSDLALRRHSLLHHLPALTREDVIVRTRAGSKRYLGQVPPKRALIWPKLRRVSTSQVVTPLTQVVDGDDARSIFTEILERSPLTCLLSMPYGQKDKLLRNPFTWTPATVAVLRRPEICRAVTYRHLDLGFSTVGPVLARATVAGLERLTSTRDGSSQAALAFGLRYLLNLHLTHLMTAADGDLMAPFDESWGESKDYRGLFFGWFAVAFSRADRLGAPEPPTEDLRSRETEYRRAAASVAGKQLADAARHIDWIVPTAADSALHGGQS